MQKDKLVLEDYETFSVRGKNRIVIFPNVPFWIAVTETGFKALEEMRKNGDKVKVAQKLYGKSEKEQVEEINKFFLPLEESNVLHSTLKGNVVTNRKVLKPNKITFLQTMRCNLRCRHCCVADMPNQNLESMSLDKAKKALDRCLLIMDEKEKGLSFLGGEPLCGEKFPELVEYARSLGFKVGLSTNGTLVDEAFARMAKKNNINVQISLDGTDRESHEFVRGKGTWDSVISAIRLLNKYCVDIQTNLVYHRGNINKLEEYFDFAINNNIKKVRLISLMNMGRAVGQMERVPLDEFVDIMYKLIKKRPDIIDVLDETSFMGLVMGARFSQKMVACGA